MDVRVNDFLPLPLAALPVPGSGSGSPQIRELSVLCVLNPGLPEGATEKLSCLLLARSLARSLSLSLSLSFFLILQLTDASTEVILISSSPKGFPQDLVHYDTKRKYRVTGNYGTEVIHFRTKQDVIPSPLPGKHGHPPMKRILSGRL